MVNAIDTSIFGKKKDYDAKINEIKGKIPSITAANELNGVEKKIPSVSTLVKKNRLWYKNIKNWEKTFYSFW